MNKIKTIYNVVEQIKGQERFAGQGFMEIIKDNKQVFMSEKTFEKDVKSGVVKGTIKTQVDHKGASIKNESSFEVDKNKFQPCGHGPHRKGMGRGHGMKCHEVGMRHHMMHMHEEHFGSDKCQGGFMKHKLNKLSLVLDILNRLEIEEKEDDMRVFSLEIRKDQMPEAFLNHLKMHMIHKQGKGHHGKCLEDIHGLEDLQLKIQGEIDKDHNIRQIELRGQGSSYGDAGEKQAYQIRAKFKFEA